MSTLSTHVLDATRGIPAEGVTVVLHDGSGAALHEAVTDADGRVKDLAPGGLGPGTYRLTFRTGEYHARTGQDGFYPEVTVAFRVVEERHYHVPLLLSPYAYSTYRGS
ncbi:MAG TPA: hydroxyisourate hydrolase [Ornithinicoccus sp.]|nr:hydroxyisourate hydrolase [Ornithinicoccus sp.]